MIHFFRHIIQRLTLYKDVRLRQKLVIFLFFLSASFVFWLLNSLNSVYTVNVSYPAHYFDYPTNKVLVNDVPGTLHLNVEGRGYSILLLKLREGKNPLKLNIRSLFEYQMIKDTAPDSWYLLMKTAKYLIQRQIGSEVEVVDVLPDTIYFKFSEMVRRRLPVEPNLTIKTEQQYILSDRITVSPDSVLVSGPAKVIDTLPAIITQAFNRENLSDTLESDIGLVPCKYVSYEPSVVHVSIPVERFTEMIVEVPVKVTNLPGDVFIKTFPSTVKVTCHVALSKYSMVKPEMFRAEANYMSLKDANDSKLKISLSEYPDYIELIDYSPKKVDYLIEK